MIELAHGGLTHGGETGAIRGSALWHLDPVIGAALLAALGLYGYGYLAMQRRAAKQAAASPQRAGRTTPGTLAGPGQFLYFATGLAAIAAALLSPIDALADRSLIIHMVQHELLIMAAAPLLLLGRPAPVVLPALPRALLRVALRPFLKTATGRAVRHGCGSAVFSWISGIGIIWLWHDPTLYDAALYSDGVHALMHASFLAAGLFFWGPVIEQIPGLGPIAPGPRLAYVLAALVPNTGLGALFTFSGTVWYPFYRTAAPVWGFTPLTEQAYAGAVMYLGGNMMFILALSILFFAWLADEERSTSR